MIYVDYTQDEWRIHWRRLNREDIPIEEANSSALSSTCNMMMMMMMVMMMLPNIM